jgi:hypothetical protein
VSDAAIFTVANYSILPFWLLLAVLPEWRWTHRLVHSVVPALWLVPLYVWMLLSDQPGPEGANYFTLDGVMNIFTTPRTVIACWIHYLIFDMFVGSWEVRDARREGIRHVYVVPCLILTLAFGPIGYFAYLTLRVALRRRWLLAENGARA